ncbi:MAG: hypothetical protein AAGA83_17170 [Cyanobacteria bacterium P01_F01_bin.116]
MRVRDIIPYALAFALVGGVAIAQQTVYGPSPPEQKTPPATSEAPRRLTINLAVADVEDLKVAEGDRVIVGQLIADQSRQRQRLDAQAQQLDLTLHRLQVATISPPLPPKRPPVILDPTYLEETAAVDQAKATIDQAEAAISAKRQEIDYLSDLDGIEPIVLEHETAKLAELQRHHTAAVRGYQLATGKRSTAEYRHSVTLAEAVANQNRDHLTYQRQVAEYEQRLRDREFQISQTQLRVNEINDAIETLAVIRSPYAGRVRRIKWLGQDNSGLLNVEITLMVRSSAGAAVPE